MPVSILTVVDLPAPLGPRRPTSCPVGISRSRPHTASTSPKRLESLRRRITRRPRRRAGDGSRLPDHRQPRRRPRPPAAVPRRDPRVAHLLERVRGERGAEGAGAPPGMGDGRGRAPSAVLRALGADEAVLRVGEQHVEGGEAPVRARDVVLELDAVLVGELGVRVDALLEDARARTRATRVDILPAASSPPAPPAARSGSGRLASGPPPRPRTPPG